MPPLPTNTLDIDTITLATDDNCTSQSGHCFGSDKTGLGGNFNVVKLDAQKTKILTTTNYTRCQHCLKYMYAEETKT
jgi:hypothetical protein